MGIGICVHTTLHAFGLPLRTSRVQGLPSSAHVVRQTPPGGSQVSGGVTTPSPQRAEQSESFDRLQVLEDGQHASPFMHCVISVVVHTRLQVAALPVMPLTMHGLVPGMQVGQELGGSQVSPSSMRPFPQPVHSLSLAAVQPGAQQPSPLLHSVIALCAQAAVQFAALPVSVSRVQRFSSSHAARPGQVAGGSQVSFPSRTPFPQVAEQLLSLFAVQPSGQHPSLF